MPGFMLIIQEGLRSLIAREEGQDLVEYALLVSLLALATIAGTKDVGSIMATLYANISSGLT
jgi:Flp pilus assembly pilin Flp